MTAWIDDEVGGTVWSDDEVGASDGTLTGAQIDVDADKVRVIDATDNRPKLITVEELVANTSSFTQSGSGALATSVQAYLRLNKFVLGWIPVSLWAGIQARTNATDLSQYVANALADLSDGDTLKWSDGDYLFKEVTTSKLIQHEATGLGKRSTPNSKPSVRWKMQANGTHLYKFSDLQTDTANIKQNLCFEGIAMDGDNKSASDAFMIVEGVSSLICNRGGIANGTGSALRMREVFEPHFHQFSIIDIDASSANGVVVIDDRYNSDSLLNVNNARFAQCHFEANQGVYFFSHQTSALDSLEVTGSKFEWQLGTPPSGGPWSLFEIRCGTRVHIHHNKFTNFSATNKYDRILEVGHASSITAFVEFEHNDLYGHDSTTYLASCITKGGVLVRDNLSVQDSGNTGVPYLFEQTADGGPMIVEQPRDLSTASLTLGRSRLVDYARRYPSMISIHECYRSRGGNAVFSQQSGTRNASGAALASDDAGEPMAQFPYDFLRGLPGHVRVGIRCKSASGAGSVSVIANSTTIATLTAPASWDVVWCEIPKSILDVMGDGGSDVMRISTGASNAELTYIDGIFILPMEFSPRLTIRQFDDFLGDVIADQWATAVGSDGQCVAPAIRSGVTRGQLRMTTGDDAGATMALNGTQLVSFLQWRANEGGLVCEGRIRTDAITNVCIFFGLTDNLALEMPFTLGGSDALTSNATDAVGVVFDTAADTDQWCAVGVANDVDATKQFLGVAPVVGAFETFRIELSTAGVAKFYRNGSQIGTTMSGAVTAGTSLTPIFAAFSRTTSSRNLDIDYLLTEVNRT